MSTKYTKITKSFGFGLFQYSALFVAFVLFVDKNSSHQATIKDFLNVRLLPQLAERLTQEFGRGFDERNLRHMRGFYLVFPIWDAVRTELR